MDLTIAQILDSTGKARLEKVNGDIDQAYDILEGNRTIVSFTLLGTIDPATRQIKTIFLPHEVCNDFAKMTAYDDKVTAMLENYVQQLDNRKMVVSC